MTILETIAAQKRLAVAARRELGLPTFFNLLGPLVNPARPQRQLLGVFSPELQRVYHSLLQPTGTAYAIVHATDGYDELSLTGPARVLAPAGERLLTPASLGLDLLLTSDLAGGSTIAASADIFRNVLHGRATAAQRTVVLANAALALQVAQPALGWAEAMDQAAASLDSGAARRAFETMLSL